MKIAILPNYEEISREAAREIVTLVLQKPEAVLALPTGDTPRRVYSLLVNYAQQGLVTFEKTTVFNLDEYLGLSRDHPLSFWNYMQKHFLAFVQVGKHYIPDSETQDPQGECERYENLIAKAGGFDLVVLGLGVNGHIAFNEPGTPFESRTHVAILAPETRLRLAVDFGGIELVPAKAITVGIRTIMNARAILLLACGKEKAEGLYKALFGPVHPQLPASVLQLHPKVTVLTDHDAASTFMDRQQRPASPQYMYV
ncbi:MAG: glucosamine-6-phosphate deaminase [Candidatus Methanomethyliaceae archaeon]